MAGAAPAGGDADEAAGAADAEGTAEAALAGALVVATTATVVATAGGHGTLETIGGGAVGTALALVAATEVMPM